MSPKQFSAYMLIYEREYVLPNPAAPPAPAADETPRSEAARGETVRSEKKSPSETVRSGTARSESAPSETALKTAREPAPSDTAISETAREGSGSASTTAGRAGGMGNGPGAEGAGEFVTGEAGSGWEPEWEPPWFGVPRPSELVPPSVFQVCRRSCVRCFVFDCCFLLLILLALVLVLVTEMPGDSTFTS